MTAVPAAQPEYGADSIKVLKGLEAGGYEGPIAYEMCSPLRGGGSRENLDRCARRFLSWLGKSFA